MTNREKLNSMTNEELASFFCDAMEDIADKADIDVCDICPVRKLCKKGQTGFLVWLNSDTDINTERKGKYNI